MQPVLQQSNGIWIGWTGDTSDRDDDNRRSVIESWKERYRYIGIDLDPETAHGFYEGIANQALWPLFHHFPALLRFKPEHWEGYYKANSIFRDEILKHLRPTDLVWIHDYHLLLLPQMLREAMPDLSIGFFLHVPFPSSSVFRILPKREELLRGILGADYVAFHTHRYLQNFRTSILRLLGLSSRMDQVEVGRRNVKLDALPIGIAPRQFNELLLKSESTKLRLRELKERFRYCKIIVGVDRLDYTKGIPERLRAYARFLRQSPEWHGKVVLIQIAVPSRERVPKYGSLRKDVDELVGVINGDFSTANWSPIVYMRRSVSQSELAALYAAADVALVTPLRDGLNLVAKEYVACKSSGDGVLVLSEFAGAAAEMGEALLINPYDEEGLSTSLVRALSLPEAERRERMLALYRRVNNNDVFAWGSRFVANLQSAGRGRSTQSKDEPVPLDTNALVQAYREAGSRLLLLDYDGTVAPYASLPQEAVPAPSLLNLLETLAGDPKTTLALVSGRSRADMEHWFGGIADIWLAAEHGAVFRQPSESWERAHPNISENWKKLVYPVLEHFVARTPGSFIEEKEFSLVWHYRMSDPEFGEWLANDLVANLEQMLAESPMRAVRGKKTVEVKLGWANKGDVCLRLLRSAPKPDFILAAGDDATDEDLFAQLTSSAWTIHVGRDHSRAKYYVTAPEEMVDLLTRLRASHGNEPLESSELLDGKSKEEGKGKLKLASAHGGSVLTSLTIP